jgi:hypothetical protein
MGIYPATETRSLSTQLGFTGVGPFKSAKSDISDFDGERVGVRGYGLSFIQRPLTRFASVMQTDLFPAGRGEANFN